MITLTASGKKQEQGRDINRRKGQTMNSANLIGRLTRDPEVRYTANNFPVCTFSVAIDRRGKEEKKTNYIPVKVLGKAAENCGKYLAKGRLVGVSGQIETDSYTDKEGNKRSTWNVLASAVEFLEWGEKNNTQNMRADATVEAEAARQNINNVLGINAKWDDVPDDIPF